MRQRDLKRLKTMMMALTLPQRRELMSELQAAEGRAASIGIIEDRGRQGGCPHCGNLKVVRNGNADGLRRYKDLLSAVEQRSAQTGSESKETRRQR